MAEPTYPDALPAQYRLHWYVLERVLGQGGFGITYLARDTNLDQSVAIKEYLPVDVATRRPDATVRARSEEQQERYRWGLDRFIREARTLARFDHPNIVRVLSVFEHNNTAYMVMRFEEGENFATLLERRRTLPEAELLRLLLPIVDGLALVHAAGFIHRDIKPDNLHIRADGTPVLLDFGSARLALGQARTVTILVAPGYAPFEQYYSTGENQGPWTDIYGLGATCYRAIAGIAPMDAIARSKGKLGSTQEILVPATAIGQGRYSARLLKAIDHALEFSEKDRPQTLVEWRDELTDAPHAAAPVAGAQGGPAVPSAAVAPVVKASDAPRAPARPGAAQSARGVMIGAIAGAVVAVAAAWLYLQAGERDRLAKELERSEQVRKDLVAQQEARQRREEDAQLRLAAEERSKREAQAKAEATTRAAEPAKKEAPPPATEAKPAAKPTRKPSEPKAHVARKTEPERAPEKKPAAEAELRKPVAEAAPAASAPSVAAAAAPKPAAAPATTAVAKSELASSPAPAQAAPPGGTQGDAGKAQDKPDTSALAHRGDAAAQFKMGELYESGRGVAQNYNQAYIWYSAAARGGHVQAKAKREQIAAKLQPAEIKQADRVVESLARQAK